MSVDLPLSDLSLADSNAAAASSLPHPRLVFARGNVCMRVSDSETLVGFLCLVEDPTNDPYPAPDRSPDLPVPPFPHESEPKDLTAEPSAKPDLSEIVPPAISKTGSAGSRTPSLRPSSSSSTLRAPPTLLNPTLFWVPKQRMSLDELKLFRNVAKTSAARGRSPSPSPHHTPLPSLTESVRAPIADISALTLLDELSVSSLTSQPTCLCRLTVHLRYSDDACLPDLWFEASGEGLSGNKAPALGDVLRDLSAWFFRAGYGFKRPEGDNDAPSTRFIVEALPPNAADLSVARRQGVPPGLPPGFENTQIYKLGAMGFDIGFGVMQRVVGEPLTNRVKDEMWNTMERFSKVTKMAQERTAQVLEHPLARPILPLIPAGVRSLILNSETEALINEYDSAAHYITAYSDDLNRRRQQRPGRINTATGSQPSPSTPVVPKLIDTSCDFESLTKERTSRRRKDAITAEEWIGMYDSQGRLTKSREELQELVFLSGVENDIRPDVWKYLLGVYPWSSTDAERVAIMEAKSKEYHSIKLHWMSILAGADNSAESAVPGVDGAPPTGPSQAGDEREDSDVVSKIKDRKYRVEKDVVRTDRTVPFFSGADSVPNLKSGATDSRGRPVPPRESDLDVRPPEGDGSAGATTEVVGLSPNLSMLRDVLLTYTLYNFELGYVQGMNDLLAPILAVMQNEVDSFWCFVGFMSFMKYNFYRDQSGMRNQLKLLELLIKFIDPPLYSHMEQTDSVNMFCCFRWLLILFKREFDYQDAMRLWEVLWACPFTKHLHLFVALAILNQHRRQLIGNCQAFDETIKYINDLSNKIQLDQILPRSELLFYVFRDRFAQTARKRLHVDVLHGVDLTLPMHSDDGGGARLLTKEEAEEGDDFLVGGAAPMLPPRSPDEVEIRVRLTKEDGRTEEEDVVRVDLSEEELWELAGLLERRE
ncbi:rab-GTPase-TBC domain-containing protein [Cladochytrium replicatum]|nr:rab-GTPase-TBC domain-containing protein [Cladochytrium replicatum]